MFRTLPLSISRCYSLYTQQWYMSYRFVDSFRAAAAGSGWNWVPSRSCSQAVYKSVWHIPLLSVQWITPDDGQRKCPKHVEFHFQNKFEKLVHLIGFIIKKKVCNRFWKRFNVCLGDIFVESKITSFQPWDFCLYLSTSSWKITNHWERRVKFVKKVNYKNMYKFLFRSKSSEYRSDAYLWDCAWRKWHVQHLCSNNVIHKK
jgi:hypothetical protein